MPKISEYKDVFEICRAGWSNFVDQALTDLEYYFRAQHTEDEAEQARLQDRELYTIDKIARQVNLLHGYEIRNRHILKIVPVGRADPYEDAATHQMSKMVMALMRLSGGYDVISDAFKWGALVQGSNLIEIWRNRNGDLQFTRLGWNQFLLDPQLTKPDLTDCKDICIGRWIDQDKAKMLLPLEADKIDAIPKLVTSGRWEHLGAPALANRAGRRLYEEWWRRATDYVDMVISRHTGQELPLGEFADRFYGGDKRYSRRRISELRLVNGSPALSIYKKPVDKIDLTIFIDNEEVWDGENPLKMDDYNFVWFHGDFCAECSRDELKLQSFCRKLRDPQRALNRRTNQIYDLIESQIQGLRLIRDKYIDNPEDAYRSGQGVVLHANENWPDELPLEQLFRQIPASEVPNSLFAALEMTDKAETDTGGLNQEIFGSDDKENVPAILGRFRTGQALTGQAGMFQSFVASKRNLGKKVVRLVQLNYPASKIAQIINEWPVPQFFNMDMAKYDCTPVEGLETDSQQEMFYLELKSLRAQFEDAAALIPMSEIIKYSPTPFKQELIEMVQRAEQQQKAIQQQQLSSVQRQAQLSEALAAGEVAKAQEDIANAAESRADAQFTRVKTLAEINKMRADALTNLIKEQVKLEIARISANERNRNGQKVLSK